MASRPDQLSPNFVFWVRLAPAEQFENRDSLPCRSLMPVRLGHVDLVTDRRDFEESHDFRIVRPEPGGPRTRSLAKADPAATPFKLVIDPKLRLDLRRALVDLIDYHDEALADHFAQGKLALDSYKEYVELFARSLKETMESREGVSYLLRSVGFDIPVEEINLHPELRWKKGPAPFGVSLL